MKPQTLWLGDSSGNASSPKIWLAGFNSLQNMREPRASILASAENRAPKSGWLKNPLLISVSFPREKQGEAKPVEGGTQFPLDEKRN